MFSKLFKNVSTLALGVAMLSVCSCTFWSRSAPQDSARSAQEYDPYTNSWRASRAIPTPAIHEPTPAPGQPAVAAELAPSSGVLGTLKKPFRWVPGVN